jgi:peptidoglycan hydrolase CwlO-like protein
MAIEIQGVPDREKARVGEERAATTKIQDFLFELVNVLKDKLNAQNSKIDRVKTDLSLIRQNDLESLKRSVKELERKLASMEQKMDKQEDGIDTRILDTLRRA